MACPSAAITLRHYTSVQIDAQLDALLAKRDEGHGAGVEGQTEKVGA